MASKQNTLPGIPLWRDCELVGAKVRSRLSGAAGYASMVNNMEFCITQGPGPFI